MVEPLVSVIMPVYNAAASLENSVRSVLSQSYTNLELILIDDASTDDSKKIITQLEQKDNRIKYILLDTNSGPGVARNTGIEKASGKYIAFLDSDDRWHPDKLKKQIAFMEGNNYLLTHTWYNTVDKNEKILVEKIAAPEVIRYKQLLKQNVIGNLTAMYNCEALGKVYMPPIRLRQDWGMWLEILKTGVNAYCIPEVLATYRNTANSLSANKWKVLKYNWIILRQYQKLSVPVSAWYFLHFIYFKTFKYLFQ